MNARHERDAATTTVRVSVCAHFAGGGECMNACVYVCMYVKIRRHRMCINN